MSDKIEKPFLGELFEEFTAIDLTGYTKTLKHANNATYLPWSNAWTILMQRYPRSVETFAVEVLENKSVMIHCTLTIISDNERSAVRQMFLPVMDGKNNAVIDPTSRAISDAQQRCFVKTLSKFGLGLHLYAGDELPKLDAAPTIPHGPINAEQVTYLRDLLDKTGSDVAAFLDFMGIKEEVENLPASKYQHAKALLETKFKKMEEVTK